MAKTEIHAEILEDGTISIKSSDIGETHHVSADQLLADIESMSGGTRKTQPIEHSFWKNRQVQRGGKIVKTKS